MTTLTAAPQQPDPVDYIRMLSGHNISPDKAAEVWPQIERHKWFLSEKLGRDVGLRVACIDFLENEVTLGLDTSDLGRVGLLERLNAQILDPQVWDTISDSQPPKRIVEKRIILPIVETGLAKKHGVIQPKTIIFFGPPGTGKTHFVKSMAGRLGWWYIEISPSELMEEGENRIGANLKRFMEMARELDKTVIFIDEFEEIAAGRDSASRLDKSITNEFLKQIPALRRSGKRILLVCATNYIHQLDAALLRHGRFDLIIPVGPLDDATRKVVFRHYLASANSRDVDVDFITSQIPYYTPADIEYLFQKVTQTSFEREYELGAEHCVDTEAFVEAIKKVKPTLNEEIISDFEKDSETYSRY